MNAPIHVLFVDDDADELLILEDTLKEITAQSYSIDWAGSFEKAMEKLHSHATHYDICLIDYRLGAMSGVELLKYIHTNNPNLPVILVTGQGDPKVDIEAMHTGAADYLVKNNLDANT